MEIKIENEVVIPQGKENIILEAGDIIQVLENDLSENIGNVAHISSSLKLLLNKDFLLEPSKDNSEFTITKGRNKIRFKTDSPGNFSVAMILSDSEVSSYVGSSLKDAQSELLNYLMALTF